MELWASMYAMQHLAVDEWVPDADSPALAFEDHWLCRRPLAGKAKDGPKWPTTREKALGLPYIEANPLAMQSLIITDQDTSEAAHIAGELGLPVPSYIALNPHTGAGHIAYALKAPVCLTDAGRRAPVNLLARIEAGMSRALSGDQAYAGRITKNPRHSDHLTLWGPDYAAYSLKELAKPLDELGALPARSTSQREQRIALATSGVGRNVALFDLTRKWAYRRRGDYQNQAEWEEVTQAYAWDRNEAVVGPEFTRGPLSMLEVTHIARSVSRWTWRNIKRTFEQEQARRGAIGGRKGGSRGGKASAKVMTDKKREANRIRATKFDLQAILEAAT